MTQNKKIAVTGGIGSGKSAFCEILKGFGYPVFSCDEVSKKLYCDREYLSALEEIFPACFLKGTLQKQALSELVFSCEEERKKLECFAHPRIMRALEEEMRPHAVCFAEVPLLFEGGYEGLFDGVIALVRDENERMKSVIARDNLSQEQILSRMRAQFPPEQLPQKNCVIVHNNGTLTDLAEQAKQVLKQFEL